MELKEEQFKLFPNKLKKEQIIGTGMSLVVILLLIGMIAENFIYIKISILLLLTNLIYPKVFYPIALFALGSGHLIVAFMPGIILTALYFILVIPMGLLRRLATKDSAQLYHWKKGNSSVMKSINHTYIPLDLEKPY